MGCRVSTTRLRREQPPDLLDHWVSWEMGGGLVKNSIYHSICMGPDDLIGVGVYKALKIAVQVIEPLDF